MVTFDDLLFIKMDSDEPSLILDNNVKAGDRKFYLLVKLLRRGYIQLAGHMAGHMVGHRTKISANEKLTSAFDENG